MSGKTDPADIAELNQLAFRYALAADTCDAALFVSCFCPEARLSVFHPGADVPHTDATGHQALARIPEDMRHRFEKTAHMMANHIVEIDGDAARGSLLCTARHLIGQADHVVVLRYIDRYARRAGAWLILNREIRFLWSEAHAVLRDDEAAPAMRRS